ncbi:IMP cyclohydrolase [Desulfonatronospira thiodismutans ASO3-1]|uniref:IMP cyclohydrolase n=1 Tax=Desulfonatronospira thiodismutans ASO3-1 TaxID=555779 RepID=D6SP64_9BACT|nr:MULTISPECIES: IMP cyclohydrolase [Desulfonatronospira]EFI34540.1 IMP cyclohydrolase [Desulfonatronospira thiodismutans ASO3-1]RQD75134.1 MAG: IMP cyclohydrolase [Desulfonatronospira sp. MSAO_Bac3]
MQDLRKMYKDIKEDPFPREMSIRLGDQEIRMRKRTWVVQDQEKGLRYGENPDQAAAMYEPVGGGLELGGVKFKGAGQGLVSAITEDDMLQAGKHPGKINLTDVDNGINVLQYLHKKPAAVILKHNNPCGAAWSSEGVLDILQKAYYSDRIAAFGGAVVLNRPIDLAGAEFLADNYLEVVAAPDFEPGALDRLKTRKNLRIIKMAGLGRLQEFADYPFLDIKSMQDGGVIVQFSFTSRMREPEDFIPAQAQGKDQVVSARHPDQRETEDLLFAWAVEAGVTSNSVLFARDGRTLSIGTGEQDRVGCVDLTIHKAYTKYMDMEIFKQTGQSIYQAREKARTDPEAKDLLSSVEEKALKERADLPGAVMVSDGFFPFRDGVDLALEQGITAIAQPGGSMRDHEVIQALNEAQPQAAMVFTGQRSFKH